MEVNAIQSGLKPCPELLGGSFKSRTQENIPPAVQKAAGIQMNGQEEWAKLNHAIFKIPLYLLNGKVMISVLRVT